MTSIEQLTEERDRLYQEHNEAFQAWMDAEVDLQLAKDEENRLVRNSARARTFLFFSAMGFVGATVLASLWSAF